MRTMPTMTHTITLNNQHNMPVLGLGTWRAEPGVVGAAVEHALTKGRYTHIDCAAIYGNEPEIGGAFERVFSSGTLQREDVFITSKLWNTQHHPDRVEAACRKTLHDLQLEYLDLYLIHWGLAFAHGGESEPVVDGEVQTENVSLQETWQAMERLVEKGLVRSIGVSNYTAPMVLDLLHYARIKPVVNQIEIHPYNAQPELVSYCQKHDIQITAYSPLGSFGEGEKPLTDPVVQQIAAAHGKTPAQVLIRWSIQRNLIVIPKSTKPERIDENSQVFDFELTDTEMLQLNKLNKNHRFVDPSGWWGVPYFK
jgi:diketogulonate reductase-like aldo/keto reductase